MAPNVEPTVEISVLTKFINKFDGTRDQLNAFLNNCRNAIGLATAAQQPILLKYILSRFQGRAATICSIKEFETWAQLEEFLRSQFGERKHYATLLSDLQSCQQERNESVNQFALRVENCLAKLLAEINVSIPTTKKAELTGRIEAMQDLALHTFIAGLNSRLSMIVRCRNPESLNDAISFAVSEEKIIQAQNKRYQTSTFNKNTSNTSGRRYNQEVQHKDDQFKPSIHNMTTEPKTSSGPKFYPLICRYCKNAGHALENCRKLAYNNRRRSENKNQSNHNAGTSHSRNHNVNYAQNCDEQNFDQGRDEVDNSYNDNNLNV